MSKRDDLAAAGTFERFARGSYDRRLFTKALYHPLSLSFGFIAHFDRIGFYAARFGAWAARVDTLETIADDADLHRSAFEVAVRAASEKLDLLRLARAELLLETERAERAELARLRAKYPDAVNR